jgi:superfamily II DNA or RNA helicase
MTDFISLPASQVKHVLAADVIRQTAVPERLGEITLRAHQLRAAARVLSIVAARGGALLAEPVGVGKTYTALAVAAHLGGAVLVIAPASLRAMWFGAAQRCGLNIAFASHESLSRGVRPAPGPDVVIVDEAHRVRSPSARRYALVADVCRNARVLLLTATPVQNARGDLAAQLALFLGRVAWEMHEEELAELVVRDSGSVLGVRPRLDGPHRVSLTVDDDCLDLLLALPPPVAAKNESIVTALLAYGLLHEWTSSRAALVASLMKRRSRGVALAAAIDAGRRPTRAELSAWAHGGDALQLAFPEIVAADTLDDGLDAQGMLVALDRHGAAVDALLRCLKRSPDPDDERAAALVRIKQRHAGERIIAFCQYAETVAALGKRLARETGIATLTARGARVAGGRISRDAVISQFTPAMNERSLAPSERVDLLITTDLLSEGLNLQEASVIVHLDLPWNPARLDQRVGRALRLGSRHEVVTVYAIAPPASAERLLRIEARLREKLSVAARTVGVAGRILPSPLVECPRGHGLAERRSTVESALRAWLRPEFSLTPTACVVASVQAETAGFLAAVRDGRSTTLIADIGDGIETATESIERAIVLSDGVEQPGDGGRADDAVHQIKRWLAARRGANAVDLRAAAAARSRRATLTRVASVLARAPRHQRSQLASLADAARAVAVATLGEGAERVLETLASAELPDEAWLRSIAAFGALNARQQTDIPESDKSRVVGLLLFGPGGALKAPTGPADT